ncbi:hypothetical protein PsorP6_016003 [Peronosclerospora sorghi]|uniref:Uncharacterized protein n=1 Tax=Peronosclerospora sorghi TaxID=230839 RepID=A0ACC0WN31_9STRA|nr:hypothetical protein PsorP6_016003 [Peronosclerospora sorghi]
MCAGRSCALPGPPSRHLDCVPPQVILINATNNANCRWGQFTIIMDGRNPVATSNKLVASFDESNT